METIVTKTDSARDTGPCNWDTYREKKGVEHADHNKRHSLKPHLLLEGICHVFALYYCLGDSGARAERGVLVK